MSYWQKKSSFKLEVHVSIKYHWWIVDDYQIRVKGQGQKLKISIKKTASTYSISLQNFVLIWSKTHEKLSIKNYHLTICKKSAHYIL